MERASAGVAVGVGDGSPVPQAILATIEPAAGGRALVLLRRDGSGETELGRAAIPPGGLVLLVVTAFDDNVRASVDNVTVEAPRGAVREGRVALVANGPAAFSGIRVDALDLYTFDFTTSRFRSFQEHVEEAVERMPAVSVVVQRDAEDPESDENATGFSYVPIDPCQGVIAAIRTAIGERISREFVDMETPRFESREANYPDPYALKRVSPAGFAAAVLPAIPPPTQGQHTDRIVAMAARLRELEGRYESILFVCSLTDWPWVRDAYARRLEPEEVEPFFAPMQTFPVDPKTLVFLLGEPAHRVEEEIAVALQVDELVRHHGRRAVDDDARLVLRRHRRHRERPLGVLRIRLGFATLERFAIRLAPALGARARERGPTARRRPGISEEERLRLENLGRLPAAGDAGKALAGHA